MIPTPNLQSPAVQPAPPFRVGTGMRMGQNPLGSWVEGPGGGSDFTHRFLVTASGAKARVSFGLVLANISVEPLIGSVPISGGDSRRQPTLRLSPSLVNSKDESWVCVEVTPDSEGKLDVKSETSKVEVVQRDEPFLTEGNTGRAPLALLVYKKARWQVFQIALFHYRYQTSHPAGGFRKHFFL